MFLMLLIKLFIYMYFFIYIYYMVDRRNRTNASKILSYSSIFKALERIKKIKHENLILVNSMWYNNFRIQLRERV